MKDSKRLWIENNRERVREYSRKHRAANLEKHRRDQREAWRVKRGCPPPTRLCPERCEGCNRLPTAKRPLFLDHDHITGKFRGWLCFKCNTALGLLGDTLTAAKNLVAYLERS